MNLITVTQPPVEPVSLDEIRQFLRIDPWGSPPEHPDDAMLESMIRASREKVEQTTRRALVSQRLRLVLSCAPADRVFMGGFGSDPDDYYFRPRSILLPKPPLIEVHSVSYYDGDNVLQTLPPDSYFVTGDVEPAELSLTGDGSWPVTYRRDDAVQVEYTAGYAPVGSPIDYVANVPDLLKSAIKTDVQLQYDEIAPDKREQLVKAFNRMLVSYVIAKF